jgi:multicomponent Na+:H+ antiporter subunit C
MLLSQTKVVWLLLSVIISIGFFGATFCESRIKKIISISILQGGVIMFFLIIGFVNGSEAPILNASNITHLFTDPVPSVLMLTAIVVGFATSTLGYAIALRIKQYEISNTIDELNNK